MMEATAGKAIIGLVTVCVLVAGLLGNAVEAAANAGLEAAREELRLRSQTERRMREEFESLLADGRMTAAEITDFESYLARLGRLVDEQRRVVAELEGGDAGPAPVEPLPGGFNRGRTDAEKVSMLDAELGSSLSEFDEKLLREQKEISEKSRAASTGDGGGSKAGDSQGNGSEGSDSQAGGEAGGDGADGEGPQAESESGGESSDGSDRSASDGGAEGGQSDERAGTGQQGGASGEGDDQVASTGRSGDTGNQASTPSDIPDGSDDDIVARQLREAAESEQDPELREKLWEEYRKYKKRKP